MLYCCDVGLFVCVVLSCCCVADLSWFHVVVCLFVLFGCVVVCACVCLFDCLCDCLCV